MRGWGKRTVWHGSLAALLARVPLCRVNGAKSWACPAVLVLGNKLAEGVRVSVTETCNSDKIVLVQTCFNLFPCTGRETLVDTYFKPVLHWCNIIWSLGDLSYIWHKLEWNWFPFTHTEISSNLTSSILKVILGHRISSKAGGDGEEERPVVPEESRGDSPWRGMLQGTWAPDPMSLTGTKSQPSLPERNLLLFPHPQVN